MTMLGARALAPRDRAAWNLLWILDHVAGEDRVDRVLGGARRRLDDRIAAAMRATGEGGVRPVDRRADLAPDAFLEGYVKPCLPVVLEGAAAGWPAVGRWTPSFFAERYGDEPVILIRAGADDLDSFGTDDYRPAAGETTVRAVARAVEAGDDSAYARFIPLLAQHPELAAELDRGWIDRMRPRGAVGTYHQLFMGGAGTTTSLHNALGSNLFVQIHGDKTWWLYPPTFSPAFEPPLKRAPYFFSQVNPSAPDHARFPLFKHARGYRVTLRPGDVLYNPPFYWHFVRNPTASIGVGIRFYNLPRILKTSATQALLTVMATNPPALTGRRLRFDFTKVFTRMR